MKKAISVLLSLVLLFTIAITATAENVNILSFARIGIAMPEIDVEINGSGYNKDDVSASLDNQKLTVKEVFAYDNEKVASCTYILVDLSTSMRASFNLVKTNIVNYINGLSQNDKIVLLTFGETEVKTILTGDEDRTTAINVVNGLKCNENGTLFYEALNQAYQMSNSSISGYDREYVLAFSDGIDLQKGNTTFDEVLKQYDSHALPLYAACSANASKEASDRFGELARTSGGSLSMIKNADAFNAFVDQINNVTLIKLAADTKLADGKEKQLSLKIGEAQVEYNVPITRSIFDDVPPTVKKAHYDKEKDAFIVAFSEKVIGADVPNAYKIIASNGKSSEVSSVFYSEKDDTYEIKTKNAVHKGKYSLEFSGIKDDSKEANELTDKYTVEVKSAKLRGVSPWAIIAVVVAVVVVAAAILIAVLFANKKKDDSANTSIGEDVAKGGVSQKFEYDNPAPNIVKHHIKADNSIRIKLRIKTGKTSEQNIETNITSSLIVGRSDICDIYIDDTKMSRQHFAIENDNGNFYVTDLQSRNGTMLNGIKINSRQQLLSGDKILAGLSEIIINIVGR